MFPDDPEGLDVLVAYDGDPMADPATWSFDSIKADAQALIVINRGRTTERGAIPTSQCTLSLNNEDGVHSPRNPTGPKYGRFGINTPVRVTVDRGSPVIRYTGLAPDWPVRWTGPDIDDRVPLNLTGVLGRLGQVKGPVKSWGRIVFEKYAATNPLPGWWPLEDGANATQAAPGLPDGLAAVVSGTVTFDAETPPDGFAAVAGFTGGGTLTCTPAGATTDQQWGLTIFFRVTGPCRLLSWTTTGSLNLWAIDLTSTTITLSCNTGVVTFGSADFTDGEWRAITVTADNSGSNVNAGILSSLTSPTNTVAGSCGQITEVVLNPFGETDIVAMGHLTVRDDSSLAYTESTAHGQPGRVAALNAADIATVAGIQLDIPTGTTFSTEPMGAFPAGTALAGLQACADADEALMPERLTGELGFDPLVTRENLAVSMTLDYAQGHIQQPFEPDSGQAFIRNDVIVNRLGGSSGHVVQESGPKGTARIGTYDEEVTRNLYTDAQTLQHAGWLVNLGTVDADRFPTIRVDLVACPELIDDWLTCDIGSRIQITNAPAHLVGPGPLDLILEGYTEFLDAAIWTVDLYCAPYQPYRIFELAETSSDAGEFVGRLAGDEDCALRTAIDDNDTSIAFDPNAFRWTTAADDFDPDLRIRVGGEVIGVSGISTTAATFVAAGTAAHANNADVTPSLPAGAAANDLLLVYAAIRNSGTGVPQAPDGYTRLPIFNEFDNAQVFAKVHSGSESNPTVTFSDGVANADTSAQMAAFRNMPITLADLADLVLDRARPLLNSAAASINTPVLAAGSYPGRIALLFGWKQDDWTSVTSPAGFTEIGEPDTTTGDDQGLTWAYRIDTTPAIVPAAAFTVTGGTSQISRSAAASIAGGFQTMTAAARSVNGVAKAHAAGTRIEVEDAFVMGL